MAAKKNADVEPELTLEDEERAQLAEEVDQIAAEAKKTFSLRDRMKGTRKYGTDKVAFVLDTEAAERHAVLKNQATALGNFHAAAVKAGQPAEEIASHLAHFNEVDEQRELALAEVLSGMLVAHLAGGPSVLSDIAARKARKQFGVKSGSTVTEEVEEQLKDEFAFRNFEAVLVHIKDADGNIAEFTTDELRQFRLDLDLVQRNRLDQAVNMLMFRDTIAASAVDDPGF